MKKVLVGVLMVILTLCTLVGCTIKPVNPGGNSGSTNGDLDQAKAALNTMYYGETTTIVGDFERISQVNVKGTIYPITWTTDATEGVVINEVNEKGMVVIGITQSKEHDINFNLIATITDEESGESVSVTYSFTIARWKENTFAEYLAAAAGDPVVVKGIVSGIMSTQLGDSYNGIYFDDGIGGYYAYDCEDPIEKGVEVGMEIRVSGLKDNYSGTHEIKDGVVEILNSEKKELAPVDFTELYANAADIKAAALVEPQALLVTIKGVTIGGQETSNGYYYFSLGGLESYVRISSSMCPLNKADTEAFKEFHSAHLGYTADVTGVICVFSGAFYLTPVSVDAFTNVQLPELDDAGKVALEKENLEVIANITEEGVVELPVIGKTFTDVTIAWASNNEAFQVAADGKLNVVLPEEATTIVLTATITSGSVQETKEFSVLIDAASTQAYVFKPISAPAAGTYKIAMDTTPANGGVLYFDGTLNSKGALQTTEKADKAVDVVVEVVDGGYTLKVGDKYLEGYLNGTYKNLRLVDNAAVWTWNEEVKVFVCDIEGIKYYFGDRDRGGYANTTMALSDIKYITGDNLSKVGVSQFPGAFVNLVLTEVYDKPITEPKAGTFKIIMNTTPANGGVLYFDGTLNSKGALQTTDKYDKAVDVVVEVVDGGYALKVGDKYLEGYLNGTYKNLRLVDNAAVWTWNEEVKVFVCDIEGIKYYFGDRDRGGYANTTMALSDIKYITGDNLSKVGVSQFPGQFTNRAFVEDNQGGETPEPPVVEPPVVEPPVEGVIDTIAELKAIATADEMTEVYTITATVTGWYNPTTAPTKYGNFYIKDATGEILVYGATATESALVLADGKYKYTNKQDFLTNDVTKNIKVGDTVTLKVVRTNHNGTAQLNAIVVSVAAHTCDANTVLEAVEAGCETVGYTAGTACSVCGAVQSGHEEVEAKGHSYANGVCTGCGAQQPTADTVTATITFDDKAKRTEFDTNHQVWVENGITITNNKASSTSNVADYVKPARFYKGSELIIAVEGGITKIEITVNSYDTNKYAQAIKAGVSNGTVTVSGQVVTIILDGSASSITISLAANQARVDSITVTYNG